MKKIVVITLSLALIFPVSSFAQIPSFPMAFWGTVTVDSVAVPAGSVIRVYDEVTKVGEITIQENSVYGYTEPTKQKLIVGSGEGSLTFKIQSPSINGSVETGGLTPVTYAGFVSGETVELNLNFDLTEEVVEEPRSSSGGGGSSRSKTKEPEVQVLGVATSSEDVLSKEEYKIVLQKQLIEILTQLVTLLKLKMSLISQ